LQIEISSRIQLPFSKSRLELFCKKILHSLKFKKADLSLLFVRDTAMREWHWKLMKDPSTTDVLSVSQYEEGSNESFPNPLVSIGDVIVCVDEARRQARQAGCSVKEELGRYVVHGILHCIGYDDLKPHDCKKMWALQERLVKRYKQTLM